MVFPRVYMSFYVTVARSVYNGCFALSLSLSPYLFIYHKRWLSLQRIFTRKSFNVLSHLRNRNLACGDLLLWLCGCVWRLSRIFFFFRIGLNQYVRCVLRGWMRIFERNGFLSVFKVYVKLLSVIFFFDYLLIKLISFSIYRLNE